MDDLPEEMQQQGGGDRVQHTAAPTSFNGAQSLSAAGETATPTYEISCHTNQGVDDFLEAKGQEIFDEVAEEKKSD